LRRYQRKRIFGPLQLKVRQNRFGYLAFILGYQLLCSTASLTGYLQELVGTRRRWK
jgi:biofilm PGA synthesis N-glycosyltransferase PgaC